MWFAVAYRTGAIAQLGEHMPCKHGVESSSLFSSIRTANPTSHLGEWMGNSGIWLKQTYALIKCLMTPEVIRMHESLSCRRLWTCYWCGNLIHENNEPHRSCRYYELKTALVLAEVHEISLVVRNGIWGHVMGHWPNPRKHSWFREHTAHSMSLLLFEHTNLV